ncbi:hypothetical protein [Haliangium sp.]|uniref:hypothetical protein n=1 Tax=Haliangium sp. TaxID=2663208 RepID=UPI003D09745A
MESLSEAMHRADLVMARHIREGKLDAVAYAEYLALVADVEQMPGGDEWAAGIAQAWFNAALVYERPVDDVERALQARLSTITGDVMRRLNSAGAAYAAYPALRSYFEGEVKTVQEMPESELRTRLFEHVERVRANVRNTFGPDA